MRSFTFLMILLLGGTALAGDVDFSGTWELNKDKSDLPEVGRRGRRGFMPGKLVITQKPDTLIIERHGVGRDGQETVVTRRLPLDGKVSVQEMPVGTMEVKARIQDDVLLVDSVRKIKRMGRRFEITSHEKWTLADKGTGLVIEFSTKTPRGEHEGKAYYDKK